MKKISIYIFAMFLMASCADLEDVQPINSIASDAAISSEGLARAAINGVYSSMQDPTLVFDGYLALPQFFSDEADATGTFPTRLEFGNVNVFPANTTMAGVFSDAYTVINNANNVIARVPGVQQDGFTDEEKNDLVGQAKFARGQMYLFLTDYWNDVPLITEPTSDVGEALNISVSSKSDIYTQIKQDFTDAASSVIAEEGPLRASKKAANAFLARIALYEGNMELAQTLAEGVLGDTDVASVAYLDDQIYSLGFTATDGNSLPFFYGTADLGGRYSIGPQAQLLNAYESGDARFALSIDTVGGTPYGIKYPSFAAGSSGTATDPVMFIRHAEMALIAAEAAAAQGNFGIANGYINQVRSRAGLADVSLTADNYIDMILQERFVEFALEGGFRLIDLRRTGKALEVLGDTGYDECDNVWPLPQRDVDRNINLNQNTCCNC